MVAGRVIVPLHHETELSEAAPAAQLQYGHGPVLTAVQVYSIFWGSAWARRAHARQAQHINAFFDAILTSSLLDLLAEYSVSGQNIGHGTRLGTSTITDSEPGVRVPGGGRRVTDHQIQQALRAWIGNGSLPAPSANTLYFVYLPPHVTVEDPQNDASCEALCGYHWYVDGDPPIFYAVMPFPDCSGCVGSLSELDALTSTSSHELCEAITDPKPWSGWNDPTHGEIGDICAWQTETVNGFVVQKEWSNTQRACVVAPNAP